MSAKDWDEERNEHDAPEGSFRWANGWAAGYNAAIQAAKANTWAEALDRLLSDVDPIPASVPDDVALGLLRVDLGTDGSVYNESRIPLSANVDGWLADACWGATRKHVALIYPDDGMVTVFVRCVIPGEGPIPEED